MFFCSFVCNAVAGQCHVLNGWLVHLLCTSMSSFAGCWQVRSRALPCSFHVFYFRWLVQLDGFSTARSPFLLQWGRCCIFLVFCTAVAAGLWQLHSCVTYITLLRWGIIWVLLFCCCCSKTSELVMFVPRLLQKNMGYAACKNLLTKHRSVAQAQKQKNQPYVSVVQPICNEVVVPPHCFVKTWPMIRVAMGCLLHLFFSLVRLLYRFPL